MVGTLPVFDANQVLDYFRGHLMTHIKDYIAEKLVLDKIPLLTISAHLTEISSAIKEKVAGEFGRFGIEVVNFYLESISVPPEDETVKRLKKMLSDKAEFETLGEQRYRTVRTFDTLQTAAGNEGGAAGVMGLGVGMGMGMGAGAGMGQMMGQAIGAHTAPCGVFVWNGEPRRGQVLCPVRAAPGCPDMWEVPCGDIPRREILFRLRPTGGLKKPESKMLVDNIRPKRETTGFRPTPCRNDEHFIDGVS
jgi:hypothetical protein